MDEKQKAEQKSFVRIFQLERCPIVGEFDLPHLLQIHQFIFQDSPSSLPGQLRPLTDSWIKLRSLETENLSYHVPYYCQSDLAQQLTATLQKLVREALQPETPLDQFAALVAAHYAELDYLHPFADGNSRTLRTFTRQLAASANLVLDWNATTPDASARDRLYKARDRTVIRRAWPGICREKADALPDNAASRAEYEAWYLALRLIESGTPLETIIRSALQATAKPVLRRVK